MSAGELDFSSQPLSFSKSSFRGATPETVKKAFEIIVSDPKVKSIFINIFGGEKLRLLAL